MELLIEIVRLKSKRSNLFLDVQGGEQNNGAKVIQYNSVKNALNQHFLLFPIGKNYKDYIIVARHSGKVLEVKNKSKNNGANITQSKYTGKDNQIFTIEPSNEDNFFFLRAKHSNKVIDIYNLNVGVGKSPAVKRGTSAVQYTFNNRDNQKFLKEVIRTIKITPKTNTTWLPFFVVKDKKLSLKQQVEDSPYYLLQKELFIEHETPHPNPSINKDSDFYIEKTVDNSIRTIDSLKETIGITTDTKIKHETEARVGEKSNYLLNKLTLEYGSSISRNISNEISLERILKTVKTERHHWVISPQKTLNIWWEHDKVVLKRMQGDETIAEWIFKRNNLKAELIEISQDD